MKTMVSLGRASVATTTVPLAVYPDSTSSILIGFCRENPYPAPCEQVYSVGVRPITVTSYSTTCDTSTSTCVDR